MKIQKINPEFPEVKKGDFIDIDDPNLGKHANCEVIAVWYPLLNDEWSESEELKHLGYCGSNPNKYFPQILIDINGRTAKVYGTDDVYIKCVKNN